MSGDSQESSPSLPDITPGSRNLETIGTVTFKDNAGGSMRADCYAYAEFEYTYI